MALLLPLHVWDRELDSRIFLSVLASSQGISSMIGNEYVMASLYDHIPKSYLMRHGRPRDNYRMNWNESVMNNNGIVDIIDEEGNNDLARAQKEFKLSYLPGVTQRSLETCSSIHTWCDLQKSLMINSIPKNISQLASGKMKNLLNLRLEILTSFGKDYFSRRSKNINGCFKNCIVIMDNMNTKLFGGGKVNHQAFLGKDTTKDAIDELNSALAKDKAKLVKFTKLIQRLVVKHPDIIFVLRPHPISSIKEWYANIGDYRNLCIIYKDTAEPWILSSNLVLHAGCTTGVQASFLDKQTIDISKLITHEKYSSISTSLSKSVGTFEELSSNIIEATRSKKSKTFISANAKGKDCDPFNNYKEKVFCDTSYYATSITRINSLLQKDLQFSLKSTLVEGIDTYNQLHSTKRKSQIIDEANLLANLVIRAKNHKLAESKISFIDDTEVELRIRDAAATLNIPTPKWYYSSTKRILVIAGLIKI